MVLSAAAKAARAAARAAAARAAAARVTRAKRAQALSKLAKNRAKRTAPFLQPTKSKIKASQIRAGRRLYRASLVKRGKTMRTRISESEKFQSRISRRSEKFRRENALEIAVFGISRAKKIDARGGLTATEAVKLNKFALARKDAKKKSADYRKWNEARIRRFEPNRLKKKEAWLAMQNRLPPLAMRHKIRPGAWYLKRPLDDKTRGEDLAIGASGAIIFGGIGGVALSRYHGKTLTGADLPKKKKRGRR